MTQITFYAGHLNHYTSHLAPIYHALPDDIRGHFYAQGRAHSEAIRLKIPNLIANQPKRITSPVVVASYEDYHRVRPASVVMLNHGVGQTYNGDPDDKLAYRHQSYSGGKKRDRVILNLCPSERDAQANRDWYPNVPSIAIGCPKMDRWHQPDRWGVHWPDPKIVVISFHMDATVCPETRWAFPYYKTALMDLAKKQASLPYKLVGHWHPRAQWHLADFWKIQGVQATENFDEVLDSAALYVCDNSSTLYEFASTGRPVVCLNAPTYRRNIEHGLRFWSDVPGVQVDDAQSLEQGIEWGLEDPPRIQEIREKAVQTAYSGLDDGRATERAVEALMNLVGAGV